MRQLAALHRGWLRQAGAEVADDVTVEISPLYALDAEELAAKLPPGTRITEPTYFGGTRVARPERACHPIASRAASDYFSPAGPSAFSFSNSSAGAAGSFGKSSCLAVLVGVAAASGVSPGCLALGFSFFLTISSRPRWILR